jgi:uncharacterized phage protein gp47/JayE
MDEYKPLRVKMTPEERINLIIGLLLDKRNDGTSPFSDFSEGGQNRNIIESSDIEFEELHNKLDQVDKSGYVQFAEEGWLDLIGNFEGIPRKEAEQSRGPLRFSFEEEDIKQEDTLIPQFSRVQNEKGEEYETIEDVTLLAGESSVDTFGVSVFGGLETNTPANTINIIVEDELDADLIVNNLSPFVGGSEKEDDDSYRFRVHEEKKNGRGMGRLRWYKSQAESISGVHDVVLYNMPFGSGYTVGMVVNSIVKPISDEVVNRVISFFSQEDIQIGGMDVFAKKASEKPVNFEITGTVARGQNPEIVKETVSNDLKYLLNGGTTSTGIKYNGFNTGESLATTQTYAVLMALRSIFPSWWITLPNADITPRSDEVLVFGEANIQL